MSPRYLKTKFPCRHCGAPAEVQRLRDEKWATCDPCAERHAAKSRAGWSDESAGKLQREAMESETDFDLVRRWLRAASKRLDAAALMLSATLVLTPAERRLYIRSARSRAKHVHGILKQLPPYFDALIDDEASGFALIDGDGETPEALPPGVLRLVRPAQRSAGGTND